MVAFHHDVSKLYPVVLPCGNSGVLPTKTVSDKLRKKECQCTLLFTFFLFFLPITCYCRDCLEKLYVGSQRILLSFQELRLHF